MANKKTKSEQHTSLDRMRQRLVELEASMAENLKTVSVYLGDLDIEIVQEQAVLDGGNFSATLRRIIREWARNYRPMPVEPEAEPEGKQS